MKLPSACYTPFVFRETLRRFHGFLAGNRRPRTVKRPGGVRGRARRNVWFLSADFRRLFTPSNSVLLSTSSLCVEHLQFGVM